LGSNSVRGGFVRDVHLGRTTAGTIGGPMLLIDFNCGEGRTGSLPPVVTDINLSDWTVAACEPAWQMAGYTTDPVGTVALTDVTVAGMTGTNTALNVADLRLTNATIAGKRVS
jgi:hypothetical protein